MSSLTSRSVVLISARLANYLALLLSPVFLVRILDTQSYGQYREFVLYAMLTATLLLFGIRSNLLYFIPKDSGHEKVYVSNSIVFIFLVTTIGLTPIFLFRDLLLNYVSFDFIGILVCYVFFYLNLDVVESYWLAKKRSGYVFLYSATLVVARIAVVIASAYYTRNVMHILYAMTALEITKFLLLGLWWFRRQHISITFDKATAAHQISFIIPLGIGTLIATLNQKFGGVFVTLTLGPAALAIYSIGIYQIPVLSIIRSAISDIIFPDMASKGDADKHEALALWQQANVIFCFLVFPVFSVFWIYSDKFITTLFTSQYAESIPVFKLMLLLMLRQCFELGTPLRSRNKNKYFYRGNLIALIVNALITFAFYSRLGLLAPALAFIVSDIIMACYLLVKVMRIYSIGLASVFMWRKIGAITLASVTGVPILIIGDRNGAFLAITLSIATYTVLYYYFLRKLHVAEVELVLQKLIRKTGLSR